MLSKILSLYQVDEPEPEIAIAKVRELTRRMPLIYILTAFNGFALAFVHSKSVPLLLWVGPPFLLLFVCIIRLATWLHEREMSYSHETAVKRLKQSVLVAGSLGALFVAWAISLHYYGVPETRGFISFYVAATAIGVTCCLLYLRAAALALTTFSIVPFALYYFSTGEVSNIATGLNTLVMACVVFLVMKSYNQDFVQLISSRKIAQERSDENYRLANVDTLTSLANRRQFFSVLHKKLASLQDGEKLCVGIVDLDGFKPVNDVFGHPAGDKVLMCVADRLVCFASSGLFVARLGGDEFAFVITKKISRNEIMELGNQICHLLSQQYIIEDGAVQISASAGIAALKYGETDDASVLFEQADYALYFAKQELRGRTVLFSEEHESAIRQSSGIEQALRNADFDRDMTLMFQPIFDAETNEITSVESLARWCPDGLPVSPDKFIPFAERTGLMNDLTISLLRQALSYVSEWPKNVQLAFNLSGLDVTSPKAVENILDVLLMSDVAPSRIVFEVTETSIMRDFDSAISGLNALRKIGCLIALDDFGTGFSSLSYLQKLPLDRIKLDKSFTSEIENDERSRNIVGSVVSLANTLQMKVVAEGIETEDQCKQIVDLGCTMLQGYLLSRPVDSETLIYSFAQHNDIVVKAETTA